MIKIGKGIEALQENCTYNIFPHVQSLIPGYFVLDNHLIFDLLFKVFPEEAYRVDLGIMNTRSAYDRRTELQKHPAWSTLFNMDHQVFKESDHKKFHYFARTNG